MTQKNNVKKSPQNQCPYYKKCGGCSLQNMDYERQLKFKQSIVNRLIATMSAVFAPFVYILAAAGLLQGLLIILRRLAPAFKDSGTDQIFSMISWSPFHFLPIFIAVTASKHFKTNTYVALFAAAALVNPTWNGLAEGIVKNGDVVDLFGIALSPTTYTSTVIPPPQR